MLLKELISLLAVLALGIIGVAMILNLSSIETNNELIRACNAKMIEANNYIQSRCLAESIEAPYKVDLNLTKYRIGDPSQWKYLNETGETRP